MSNNRSTSRIAPKGAVRLSSGFARLTAALSRAKLPDQPAFGHLLRRFAKARRNAAISTYQSVCVGACPDASSARPATEPGRDQISTNNRPSS